jgi:hypothetical protein
MSVRFFRISAVLIPILMWISCIRSEMAQEPGIQEDSSISRPISILEKNTLFTVYGRSFNRAPILGRLGTYSNFEDMDVDIRPWVKGIDQRNGEKGVIPALHLIYGMAIPCTPGDDCLLYLEGIVKDIVGTYIEPAAKRGWMVVLDTQLGKSNPVQQVKRIIDKGYLKYDNVIVAIDPEFRVREGSETPGRPIGTVHSSEINEVQRLLHDYVATHGMSRKKILIVHQFGDSNVNDGVPFMIQNKKSLRTYDNVDLVICADGLGKQAVKVVKYNKMTDAEVYPFIQFRGIKLFFPNPWERHEHYDKPPMNLGQLFGLQPVEGGARMQTQPDVIIIA